MYCRQCGNPLNKGDRFCGSCGAERARAGADPGNQAPDRANSSGQDTRGRRRIPTSVWVLGAVVLAVLGIGVGVMASGGGRIALLSGVRSEIPDGWSLHSSSAAVEGTATQGREDSGSVGLVPEQYTNAEDVFAVTDKAARISVGTNPCSNPSDEIRSTPEPESGGEDVTATKVMNSGSATVGGKEAQWTLFYGASSYADPFYPSGYTAYNSSVFLGLCFKDPHFHVTYIVGGVRQDADNPPTAERNASVPEYRAEVGKDIRQRYEDNIGAMTQLLEDMSIEGQSGNTNLTEIPTSLDNYSGVFEDPFEGKLEGDGSSSSSDSAETGPESTTTDREGAPTPDGDYFAEEGEGCVVMPDGDCLINVPTDSGRFIEEDSEEETSVESTSTSAPEPKTMPVTPGEPPFCDKQEGCYSLDGSQIIPYNPKPEQDAVEQAIRFHYEAIGDGDFEEAYSYFGPTFRSENTQEDWISEEQSQGIQDSTINSIEVTEVSGDEATAEVDIEFEDNSGTPRFNLTWSLVKEDGEWKLDELVSGEEVE